MTLTVTGKLTPSKAPAPARTPKPSQISRAAPMLALAHHVDDLVERGVLRDYADAAHRLGITRARMTQIMDLLMLAPRVQEGILTGEISLTERGLRQVARTRTWGQQHDS